MEHPPKRDLLNLHIDSILDCKIERKSNVSNEKSITSLQLINHIQIDFLVEEMSFTES